MLRRLRPRDARPNVALLILGVLAAFGAVWVAAARGAASPWTAVLGIVAVVLVLGSGLP